MTSIKIVWKFSNGRRGSQVVHTDPGVFSDPVRRADFLSRMSNTVVPIGAFLVNWQVVA